MNQLLRASSILAVILAGMLCGARLAAQQLGEEPDTTVDTKVKSEAIGTLVADLKQYYVFPDTGNKVAAMLEENLKSGSYDSITSAKQFADALTKQMYEIAHDKHLHVFYEPEIVPLEHQGARQGPTPQQLMQVQKTNYGFEDVARLDGNIGYFKFHEFSDAELGGPTLAGAMAFLANTDAMIIDLRHNHGGRTVMVDLLASYFFSGEQPVHLNDVEYRTPNTREYITTQWWVLPYVSGQRYVDKEVYILTSSRTYSAAEDFSYAMQSLKRATLVGETTRGGANPRISVRLGDHFSGLIPNGHSINPITHTNWEGSGITPNVAVPADDALKMAQKMALEHLLAKSTDPKEQVVLNSALAKAEAVTRENAQ